MLRLVYSAPDPEPDTDNAEEVRVVTPTGWMSKANCLGVDPELMFPGRGASLTEAYAVCQACVVKAECLEFALANNEKFGVWGGTSERERRRLRQVRTTAIHAAEIRTLPPLAALVHPFDQTEASDG